jgi:hypothetical protein
MTKRALEQAPWDDRADPLEGVILHESETSMLQAAE